MDVDLYLEVRALFHTKWDPVILDVLAERPYRYLALVRRLRRQVDDQLVDGHVTRSLTRLQDLGFVRADTVIQGRQRYAVYGLTDDGRYALGTYRAILTTYVRARSRHPDAARCQGRTYTAVRSGQPLAGGTNEPAHPHKEGK